MFDRYGCKVIGGRWVEELKQNREVLGSLERIGGDLGRSNWWSSAFLFQFSSKLFFRNQRIFWNCDEREVGKRLRRQNKERGAFGRGVELCTIFVFVELCAPVKNLKRICIICGLRWQLAEVLILNICTFSLVKKIYIVTNGHWPSIFLRQVKDVTESRPRTIAQLWLESEASTQPMSTAMHHQLAIGYHTIP